MKSIHQLPLHFTAASNFATGMYRLAVTLMISFCIASAAVAAPWVPLANPVLPAPGNGLPTPQDVPGKDYSRLGDTDEFGAADAEQVVAWDGSGGVRNSFDYSGSRALLPADGEVDALSAGGDALFSALRADQAALLFSASRDGRIMYVRPTSVPNPIAGFGVWANPTDIDVSNPPVDLDALEVWGGDQLDDSDRYSLAGDPFVQLPAGAAKVAIWDYDSTNHVSNPHTFTSDLAAAMDLQYFGIGVGGPLWSQLVELMDLDAMMTFGPQVTFSIEPLNLSTIDPLLPDFDGGEIFLYDGPGTPTSFLVMGGYTWNTALDVVNTFGVPLENINALEAVSVPEPGSLALAIVGAIGLAIWRRRRRR
jgi:hypothetical protein